LAALNRTLESADKFVKRLDSDVTPAAKTALEEARRTLTTAERTLNAEAPLQQDVRGALRDLSRAAQAMRALADSLERHPEALLRGKKEQKP
jgi:paraquat-inducible protein B